MPCKFFKQNTFPDSYRQQILDKKYYKKLCPGGIPIYDWTSEELPKASLIGVNLKPNTNQVSAFMLIFDHKFYTKIDGKYQPICGKNELYLHLICSGFPGSGGELLNKLYIKARALKKNTIRLYSIDKTIPYWAAKGFIECDDPIHLMGCYRKRDKYDPEGGIRMTRSLEDNRRTIQRRQ
jgi:hypothetical protein